MDLLGVENALIENVLQGGSIGYNIRSKFYTISRLKKHLVKLKIVDNLF